MMLNLILGAAAAPRGAQPTSLLKLVAGEFAPQVAAVWPEPHAAFLTAATARRHLVCLALALGLDIAHCGERLLRARLRDAVRETSPSRGLERALARLGETAWTAPAYRRLIDLLNDPNAAKLLRHAEAIDHAVVARLNHLPDPMSRGLRLAALLTDDGAQAVAEACLVIGVRAGAAEAEAAAVRWAGAESEAALFEAVRDDLYPDPPAPPFAGTPRLKPLATKAALRDAARRFNNCLASRLSYAVTGNSAYYEWTEAPGAIVEIDRDAIFGWRLNEAKGPNNNPLAPDARRALAADLTATGIHVGRSGWQLERALAPGVGRDWRLPEIAEDLTDVFGG